MDNPLRYQSEAASVEGFIQQLAVSYVSNGYFFYVAGSVPEGKDPRAVDAKLIERYGIGVTKWTRADASVSGLRACSSSDSSGSSCCSRLTERIASSTKRSRSFATCDAFQ